MTHTPNFPTHIASVRTPPHILSRAPMRVFGTAAAVAALMLSSMMMSTVHAGEEYAPSPEVRVHVFRERLKVSTEKWLE